MYKKIASYSAIFIANLLPTVVAAQCADSQVICNPLEVNTITAFLGELVRAITTLAIPVIVIFIIYSGFLFVTAGGDQGKLETAKKTAFYTMIGSIIILGARLLSDILVNTAGNLGV